MTRSDYCPVSQEPCQAMCVLSDVRCQIRDGKPMRPAGDADKAIYRAIAENYTTQTGAGCVLSNDDMHQAEEIAHLKDLLGKANALARIRAERIKELEAQAGAEPVAFLQFLTDVVTAAGLLSHGKTDKVLAARISNFAFHLRFATQPTNPTRVPLTENEISEIAERMEALDPTDSFWREFANAIIAAYEAKNGIGGGK